MAAVWESRFAEYVRRLAALRESTALELLPDLMPVLPVVDIDAPEQLLARRERLCHAFLQHAPTVGQYASVAIENSSTNVLVIVERILVGSPSASQLAYIYAIDSTSFTGGATSAQKAYKDLRGVINAATTKPQAVLRSKDQGAAPLVTSELVGTGTAGVFVESPGSYVLPPGTGLIVHANQVTNSLNVGFHWRERVVDPTELTFTGA